MPNYFHVSYGSQTLIKSGYGQVYGVVASSSNLGGTVVIADSTGLGATPNYVDIGLSSPSNMAYVHGLSGPFLIPLYGASFHDGLVVASTSNYSLSVFYD
jgi:hypothetical protein